MRLSAEIYEQILSGLKSDGSTTKDKRREPRVGLAGEADFVTVGHDGRRQAGVAKIRDVSRNGIGLLLMREIPKHQRFVVQLASSGKQPIWLVCNVAHCRRTDMGNYSVGAKIIQILHAAEIDQVESKAAAVVSAAAIAAAERKLPKEPAKKSDVDEEAKIARIARAILDG